MALLKFHTVLGHCKILNDGCDQAVRSKFALALLQQSYIVYVGADRSNEENDREDVVLCDQPVDNRVELEHLIGAEDLGQEELECGVDLDFHHASSKLGMKKLPFRLRIYVHLIVFQLF